MKQYVVECNDINEQYLFEDPKTGKIWTCIFTDYIGRVVLGTMFSPGEYSKEEQNAEHLIHSDPDRYYLETLQ